jgi:hypothetical protein
MESANDNLTMTEKLAKSDVRRRWLVPLAVVVLFAAGVLHFARLQWQHLPADQRVNNGAQPTFFAPYLLPSFNFSEDFYLYHVRAKRIADRGWSDSLLYSRPEEGTNVAAPVQVGLSKLAITTDGRPVPYSLYMFAILATAWIAFYAAARCWLPAGVRTASILVAVLLTVLFESTHYFVVKPEYPTFGQWPMFRGLRMSTMSWTNPLLVAVMLCITSLVVDRQRWWARIVLLAGMLLLLAGADNWAFGMAWFATALVGAWIASESLFKRWRSGAWPVASRATVCGLGIVVSVVFLLHQLASGSMQGDMLMRGGFGAKWADSVRNSANIMKVRDWFVQQGLFPVGVALFGSWIVLRTNSGGRLPVKLTLRASDATAVQIRCLALLPLVAMVVMYSVLKSRGMEPFLRHQLFWRVNYCWLFVFVLAALEWWREASTTWGASQATHARGAQPSAPRLRAALSKLRPKSWAAAMTVGIAALLVYHNYRLHWFVGNVAARDFFLTADAEKLRPWLEEYERKHGQFELATASVELNYLAAYWTNADLLLPSGFPYHNAAENQEIRERTVQVLQLYGATPKSWNEFVRPTPGRFQEAWQTSRIKASGRGYLYHLYHRLTSYDAPKSEKWKVKEHQQIRRCLTQPKADDGAEADNVAESIKPLAQPDVIIVDEVSRALGQPDLTSYDCSFRSETIEAWVRRDAAVAHSTTTMDEIRK